MKGIILTNANYDTPSTRYQTKRLSEEFEKLGVKVTVQKNDGRLCTLSKCDFDFDFCIFLDKDVYTAEHLERRGVKVFNRAEAIKICDDKMQTYLSLLDTGVAIPNTVAGVYSYLKVAPSEDKIDYLETKLSYPMVVKLNSSSLGAGVFLARDRYELQKTLYEVSDKPHHVQEYVAKNIGEDVRVIVIGGKVVASMLRKSKGDFRSNVELGGTASPVTIPDSWLNVAERVADIIGLDYCGIDLLEGDNGAVVCEVNSNAFFGGIEEATGINVAGSYASHVLDKLKG